MQGGDQNFFPVYEPDADVLKEKYRKAEEESRQVRYDASREGTSLPPLPPRATSLANRCPSTERRFWRKTRSPRRPHACSQLTSTVRDRAAGAYQFALDDETRARQLAELKAQRLETERARAELSARRMTAAQEQRQRLIDERMVMLERKREEKYGGKENLQRLRREKAERQAEALLEEVQRGLT